MTETTTPVTIEVTIKGAIAQFNQIVPKEMAALAVEEYIKAEVAKVENLVIADMHDKEGYEKVKRARLDLGRGIRVPIEKKGKELRADAIAYQKAVIAEEDRLVGIITPAEKKLKQMEDEYDRLWEEKRLKDEAEQKAKVDSRIQALTELGMRFDAATSFYYLPEGAATIGTGHIQAWNDAQFTDFTTKVAADIERKRKQDEEAAEALQRFNERKAALTERGFRINEAKNEISLRLEWVGSTGDLIYDRNLGLNWLETIDDLEFNDLLDEVDVAIAYKKSAEAAEQKRKDDELAEARRQVEAAKEEIRKARMQVITSLSDYEMSGLSMSNPDIIFKETVATITADEFEAAISRAKEIGRMLAKVYALPEETQRSIIAYKRELFMVNQILPNDFTEAQLDEYLAELEKANHIEEVPYKEEPLIIHEDESLNVGPEYDKAEEILTAEDEPQAEYALMATNVFTLEKQRLRFNGANSLVVDNNYRPNGVAGYNETQYYGGYLVCESITKSAAELIIAAWDSKYFAE